MSNYYEKVIKRNNFCSIIIKGGYMKKIIFFIGLFILIISISIGVIILKRTKKADPEELRNFDVDLTNVSKVMFVAHPDDDMIWGGAHLINDDYLVVCITCGSRADRVEEFKNVMTATKDKYIMLDYPDKTNGERDNWDTVYDDITKDVEKILAMKDWELIVTHNENGEYGHIHHKMTHSIVTGVYENNYLDKDNLYFFGKYYKKENLDKVKDKLPEISEENYNKKNDIIYKYYTSQKSVADGLSHMFKYENWDKYHSEV